MTATESRPEMDAPPRRNPAIRLPGSFILTDEGVDVVGTDLVGLRGEIIDTTKLVFYGLLYRRLRPILNGIMFRSGAVQQFNRANPRARIEEDLRFPPEKVKAFMDTNGKAVRALKAGLLFGPFAEIATDPNLDERQKQEQKLVARTMIDRIEDKTWFLFHYLSKSAEKEHYLNLASRDNMSRGPNADVMRLLRDADFRDRLKRNAKSQNILLNVNLRFTGDMAAADERIRLVITVAHRGRIRESRRKRLQEQAHADVRNRPLSDLYQAEDAGVESSGPGVVLPLIPRGSLPQGRHQVRNAHHYRRQTRTDHVPGYFRDIVCALK